MKIPDTYGIVVQARFSSTRLPGKALRPIVGKPMLQRQLERLRNGFAGKKLWVATSTSGEDDAIEELALRSGAGCYRGSLGDVMGRLLNCAHLAGIDYLIRVGGDDPLIDWECCNYLAYRHMERGGDFLYASNRDGWPYGAAAELLSVAALEKAHSGTAETLYLEHTIPYFFDHPEGFLIDRVPSPSPRPDISLTVDYPEDFQLVVAVFESLLATSGEFFGLAEVIRFLDANPEVRAINSNLHSGFER